MNRIILAYSGASADLAQSIDNQLSRIGIPFEHLNSSDGNLAKAILATGEPVVLLVSDNFLKERACMEGLLDCLAQFPTQIALLPVLADGIGEAGAPVETRIDRMVNMLHYMNHWQKEWLNVSAAHNAANEEEKAALEPELEVIRTIANQTSDIISAIREKEFVTIQEFEAKEFELFFQKFDLLDWHGQYRLLVRQSAEKQEEVAPALLPESPISSGVLAPEPMEEPLPETQIIPTPEPVQEPQDETVIDETPEVAEIVAEKSVPKVTTPSLSIIEQTIRDAQLWIDRGHEARGIELLKTAAEEYPDDEQIAAAYKAALPAPEMEEAPVVETQTELPIDSEAVPGENDINSYNLMGDMAYNKGDYLFAKYCWDRVAELNPDYDGIYRKLGLMTAEHLHDYRDTAVQYLNKALKAAPKDKSIESTLNGLLSELEQEKSPQKPKPEAKKEIPKPEGPKAEKKSEQAKSLSKTLAPGTILITGATSGIGRATAELFAKNGYRLILTGRREERLTALKKEFEETYNVETLILPFDVRDRAAVKAALENLPAPFKKIDILLNNAGLAKGLAPIQEGNIDHWENMIDTNVKGLLYVTRCIAPGMVARRQGHIINIGSSAGKEVYPNGNVYCASKFAVDGLTKAIRLDLHAHNIRVSQVSPGHVEETEFAVTRFDGDAERAKIYDEFQPLKSSDVAEVIYFMVTRPPHVNIQDVQLFGTQQASNNLIDRSGR